MGTKSERTAEKPSGSLIVAKTNQSTHVSDVWESSATTPLSVYSKYPTLFFIVFIGILAKYILLEIRPALF